MKHVFFDLDRTLWDFETNSKLALNELYDDLKLGDHMKSFQSFHHAYKNINGKLWAQYSKGKITKEVLRIKRFEDTLKQFQLNNSELAETLGMSYIKIAPYRTHVFPNTHSTLEGLLNDGFQLHIITNGFKEVQFIKLEKSGLLDYFDVIVCSEDVGKNKPDPDVFHHSLNLANAAANESVMIGDNMNADINGSEGVGMTGVLFDPHKSYKMGTHNWHIHDLEKIPEIITWINRSNL